MALDPKQYTILIADDDSDYLFQTQFQLKQYGFQIITAETQKEAEKIIEETRPDLAIFDLMMETEDSGFILSHKLKKRYSEVPVIITTSVATQTGISFGLNSEEEKKWIKADAYLEKGVRIDQLYDTIINLLSS